MSQSLKINSETSLAAKIRVQPDNHDEIIIETGWIRLSDLVDILNKLRTDEKETAEVKI